MNKKARKQAVLAMEEMIRCINDEYIIERWLMEGVADGDIKRFDINEVDEGYIEDKTFKGLLELFLELMNIARKDGGLYIDGIGTG